MLNGIFFILLLLIILRYSSGLRERLWRRLRRPDRSQVRLGTLLIAVAFVALALAFALALPRLLARLGEWLCSIGEC